MIESPTLSDTKTGKPKALAQSFTMYMQHIGELASLAEREQRKYSPIVCDAIDLYYLVSTNENMQDLREMTKLSMTEIVSRAIAGLHQKITKVINE